MAARVFAERGVEGVTLEEIADLADVARGTLYSHFSSKDALLCAILRPVLEHATRAARGMAELGPRRGVEALCSLYLDLWREHSNALRVSHTLNRMPVGDLAEIHQAFVQEVLRIFDRSARAGVLRSGVGQISARVVMRLAVPLLELCADHPRGDQLFRESLDALLRRR